MKRTKKKKKNPLTKYKIINKPCAKNEAAHHVPTLGPGNRDLISKRKRDQTAWTGTGAMTFTMLHVFPGLQSLDRLGIIQTGNEIDGDRAITELPSESVGERRREIR